ncbi:TonB-dependent receptor [Caulobacter sp. 602-2]|uniref:TonB-dependent receptor n=1 Tax=Caulobacter sp. 602-2 TaxID=2710887 RepID=A0A6G4QZX1_9CAUL|nr:TonB-dependent receptor [Caulobacter sp. 602-2]NGM50874.1 TonB-dependent receptor [Caulobacter sp. 602-2]
MIRQAHTRRSTRIGSVSILALTIACGLTSMASAQTASPAPQPGAEPVDASTEVTEVVVTGFRASLNKALVEKRTEAAAIDSIVAEDIGKFPDANLAESMQRVPGVALSRGDGGEGRNISVRGLGAAFTRVRVNGMEAAAQTGASDIYGAANSGRSFDFNVFPTEIFSALTVRKTTSADVEEGSLGATVDLSAPRPLDQRGDFVFTATARGVSNELAKDADPRLSALVSKTFDDGRWGVLGSLSYQKRHLREVGYSAVDILSANTNGGFCSPIGFTPQNPANNAAKGADAANCSTGNPRTSSLAAYQTIYNARRADLSTTAGSGAFFPRLPRYSNSEQEQKRVGGSFTLQFKPDDRTDISLDLIYSKFNVVRDDNYIEAVSFARSASNNGQPMTSVKDVQLSSNGSVIYGLFDGVDVRSEGLHSEFSTTFKQANLNFKREISDRLKISGVFGVNDSKFVDKMRFQYFMDAIDTDNFSIDYRDGGSTPILGFGFDVSNPANYAYAPALADGTVLGGFSFQSKPASSQTQGIKSELNLDWAFDDALTFRFGGQYRSAEQKSFDTRIYTADAVVKALPAGVTLASLTKQISGVDKLWGRGAPSSWASLDWAKLIDAYNLDEVRTCHAECGSPDAVIREEVLAGYAMAEFKFDDVLGLGVRGDAGVRYVHTDQYTAANVAVTSAASPTGVTGQRGSVDRSYEDWLPSANLVVEATPDLLFRFAASKVMARPDLGSLTPSSGVNPVTRTGTVNNPYLDPIRAKTFDASVEWYFHSGALLSAAFFYKDIDTYIQRVSTQTPFNQLGLPVELLAGSNTSADELFTVSTPFNTKGGPLKGLELNAQVPLFFLPGKWSNFGVLANYTYVTSEIDYILASVNGVPTVTTTADLVGLSKNTASGTFYYEDNRFGARVTANYRGSYIRGIPASAGSDLQGNAPTLFVDASASYEISDRVKLILEVQNLTDEQNRLYVDSVRKDTLFETRVGRNFTFGVNYRF